MPLEVDKKMYEELLQPLHVAAPQCQGVDPTYIVDLDDDEDITPQQGAINLCE